MVASEAESYTRGRITDLASGATFGAETNVSSSPSSSEVSLITRRKALRRIRGCASTLAAASASHSLGCHQMRSQIQEKGRNTP